jgi:hypothetical protein
LITHCRCVPSSLAGPLIFFEKDELVSFVSRDPGTAFWVTAASSVLAAAYNVVHWQLCGNVGPTTTTILGQVKIISLVVISKVFLEDQGGNLNREMLMGFGMSFAGFLWYGWLEMQNRKEKSKTK